MPEALALKYRPRMFDEMIGQDLVSIPLSRMVERKLVPEAMLFTGPSGVGKTTAARVLASVINDGLLYDSIVEIDAASHSGVADVRALLEQLRYATVADKRIVILDEAQSMSREAFEKLLAPLEKPPENTHFVLITTEPEKIPEPIKTRVIEFEFRRVAPEPIYHRLEQIVRKEEISAEPLLLQKITDDAQGSVRSAIMTLDKVFRSGVTTLPEYLRMTGASDPAPIILNALLTNDPSKYFLVLDDLLAVTGNPQRIQSEIIHCIRDLHVLRVGGELKRTGAELRARKELVHRVEPERLLAATQLLWDLKTKVRISEDPRGNLELTFMLIAEVFSRGKTPPAAAPVVPVAAEPVRPAEPPKKLTLADMQRQTKEIHA